jgi:hypothetical protein
LGFVWVVFDAILGIFEAMAKAGFSTISLEPLGVFHFYSFSIVAHGGKKRLCEFGGMKVNGSKV